MKLNILKDTEALGKEASKYCADVLNQTINEKGSARLVLSTGASQLSLLKYLIHENVEWNKVEMFHLDEYVNLSEQHPASFRKYLKERFVQQLNLKNAHFVNGEGNIRKNIQTLSDEINKEDIDLALIGVGENAHIAFNDPPADFDVEDPYIVVELDEQCKQQQVGEGWFKSIDEVPKKAITMTVKQIMKSKVIVSFVPYKVKASAVKQTLASEVTNMIPATILKTHPQWSLYLDEGSSSDLKENLQNS